MKRDGLGTRQSFEGTLAVAGDPWRRPLNFEEPLKLQRQRPAHLEPALDRGGLMSGMVVDNQVQVEIGRNEIAYQLEKTQELRKCW
jgi:hypothetical protein